MMNLITSTVLISGQQLVPDNADAESTKSGGTESSSDTDVPLKPTNDLDKRVSVASTHLNQT